MALDVLTGAAYHDAVKPVQKPRSETNVQEQSPTNINITEIQAAVKTTSGYNLGSEKEKGQKENSASEKQIKEAISKANNKMRSHLTRCEFSYHEETKRVSIKVVDKDTEEVIREIPPEEALEMLERMWELAGILIDERR